MAQQVNVLGVGVVEFPDGMSQADIASALKTLPNQQPEQPTEPQPRQLEDGEGSDFTRGIGTYYDQMGGIFGGAKVLAGKAFGSDDLIKSGLESMEESDAAIGRRGTKQTDSFTEAIDKGVGSFLTEYIPFVAGQGVGMIGEAVLTGVVGSIAGSALLPGGGTVAGGLTGLVGKNLVKKEIKNRAEQIAREQGKDVAEAYIQKEAKNEFKELMKDEALRSQVNKTIGRNLALGQMGAKFGAGETTGRAVDEAIANETDPEKQLEIIKELSTSKLAAVSTAHALADYLGIKIGLGALDGLAKPTQNMLLNIAKQAGLTGIQEAPVEAIQTALERFGADLPLGDKQAFTEYLNAAAAGFFMPLVPSVVGGIRTPTQTQTETDIDIDAVDFESDTESKTNAETDAKTKERPGPKVGKKVADKKIEVIEEEVEAEDLKALYTDDSLKVESYRKPKTKADKKDKVELQKIVKAEKEKVKVANKKVQSAKTPVEKKKAEDEFVAAIAAVKEAEAAFEMPDFEETNQKIINKNKIPLAFTPQSDAEIATEEQISESEATMGPVQEGFERIQVGYDKANSRPILEDRKSKKQIAFEKEIDPDRFELTSPRETIQETVDVEEQTVDPISAPLPGIPTIQDQQKIEEQDRIAQQQEEMLAKQKEREAGISPEADISEANRIVKTVIDNNGVLAEEVVYQSDAGPIKPEIAKNKALRRIKNEQVQRGLTETHTIKEVKGKPVQVGTELVSDTKVYYLAPRKSVGTLTPNVSQNADKLSKFLINNLDIENQDVNKEGALVLGKKANPAQIRKWFKDNVTAAEFSQIENSAKGIFARINTVFNQPAVTKKDEAQTTMEEAFSEVIVKKAQEQSKGKPATSKPRGKDTSATIIQSREFIEDSKPKTTIGELLTDFRKNLRAITKGVVNPMQEALLSAFEDMPGINNTKLKVLNYIKNENEATGTYDTKTDTIRITKDATIEDVFHEITHAATANEVRKQIKDGVGVTRAGKRTVAIYKAAKKADKNNRFAEALSNIDEFITYALTNQEFQMFLAQTPSAVATPTTVTENSLWSNFVSSVKELLGMDISNTLLNDILAVAPELMKGPRAKEQAARKSETLFKKKEKINDIDVEAAKYEADEKTLKQKVKEGFNLFEPGPFQKTLLNLRKKFQNSQAYIQDWQAKVERAGKLISGSLPGFNNIFTKISLNRGRADIAFKEYVLPATMELEKSLAEYEALAKEAGIKLSKGKLNIFLTALHDSERRDILFALGVPLSTTKNLKVGTKRKSASEIRNDIMQIITKRTDLTDAQIANLRKTLMNLVSNPANQDAVLGVDYRGNKVTINKNNKSQKDILDKNSNRYNPSKYSKKEMDIRLAEYNNTKNTNPKVFKAMQKVREALKRLHDVSLDLNSESFYSPTQSQNIIKLYGFENYIPLKAESGSVANKFNVEGPRVSGDLVDAATPMGGQKSQAENVFEQSIEDALAAAARIGRNEVTQAVKNAVTYKWSYKPKGAKRAISKPLIEGSVQTFTAEDRIKNPDQISSALKNAKDKIVNYNQDGSIDIISVKDRDLLEGIKGTYNESSFIDSVPILNKIPTLTSWVGQMHTRFNLAFAPLNFVRDTLTNAAIISSEMGAKRSAEFLHRMSQQIYKVGLRKTYIISNKFANTRDIAGIRAYIEAENKKGNTYPADMWDFLTQGGAVSYRQAITDLRANQEMRDQIAIKGIKKTANAVKGFFDGYMSTFELSARVAAYQTKLDDILSEKAPGQSKSQLEKSNPDILKAAQEEAAAFSKNLANFEQVGESGKTLGGLFMFFRPSATGAARGLDAIAPIFIRDFDAFAQTLPDFVKNDPQALAKYKESFLKQQASAKATVGFLIGIGMAVPVLAALIGGEDEEGRNNIEYDSSDRWLRMARFDIGDGEVVQIPWGFGIGGFAAMGAQINFLMNGLANPKTENSPKQFFGNMINIALDSFLPLPISRINPFDNPYSWFFDSAMPTAVRPMLEYTLNLNAFGQPIYNPRQSLKYGDAYGGTDNIPQAYKDASIKLAEETVGGINIEPNVLYFYGNNYFDGITRLASNLYGLGKTITGEKNFDKKRDLLLLDSFFSKNSKVDQRAYARVVEEAKDVIERVNLFKETNPEKFVEYISRNPLGLTIEKRYNKLVNGDLKEITSQMKQIRMMPGISPKEKNEIIEVLKEQQNQIKRVIAFELDIYLNEEVYD
jgi:hypothetical protein